jgi:hypothetical protein
LADHTERFKLKLKIIAFNNKRSNYFAYLGELVFRSLESGSSDPLADRNVQRALEEIRGIQSELAKSDREINLVREKARKKRVEMGTRKKVIWDTLRNSIWPEEKETPKAESTRQDPRPSTEPAPDREEPTVSSPPSEPRGSRGEGETSDR